MIVAAFACVWAPSLAFAQGTAPAAFSAGVEQRRLTYEYRFENDSTFDTAELVPHFFVQHYEGDQTWLTLAASYPLAGAHATTWAGYAPERVAFGSDFDTFFQPDGDIATSGTAGDVRLRAFSLRQEFSRTLRAHWTLGAEFAYTNRRADYLPADRVVTHTRPPSETREFITTREVTTSHEFEVGATLERRWEISQAWDIAVRGVAWPAIRGRLVTVLPDKYPGRDIVFEAAAFGGRASAELAGRRGGLRWSLLASAGGVAPYRQGARFRRSEFAIGVNVGFVR